MRPRPIVPAFSLLLAVLCGMLALLLSPTVVWSPSSYDGGVQYIQHDQPLPAELQATLLDSCKTYIADGMAAADGYPSGMDFYAGCYQALGG
jgi:hypothetical protein